MLQDIFQYFSTWFTSEKPNDTNKPETPTQEVEIRGTHEQNMICDACKQKTVYYLDTDVMNGNLSTGASDCDVIHHYKCKNCLKAWSSYC